MGMAMFKRTFARTIPDNLRASHMKMWGFKAKRASKFTRISPRTLPWKFITMLSAPLIRSPLRGLCVQGALSCPSILMLLILVAHDCGYPLSRYTCRATRVAADFLEFIAFCRCSSGVAPQPPKTFWCRTFPPPIPGRCRTEIWV